MDKEKLRSQIEYQSAWEDPKLVCIKRLGVPIAPVCLTLVCALCSNSI